jgi:subtilisin family serine protease
MDPALQEALRQSGDDELLEAGALLRRGAPVPQELRVVARFGDVVTCRLRAADVRPVRGHSSVASLKAARPVDPAQALSAGEASAARPRGIPGASGRGVVVAALDWGCDFAHPCFRRADGTTRLVALWDQRDAHQAPENRYGYGRILGREMIDAALRTPDPYASLGYHPGGILGAGGRHGTHVLDIAAGTHDGLAPEAELVFVHLASGTQPGLGDLGDSVRILEALDFVRSTAGDRPWVVNMSLGRTGGDHSGRSLVERAIDALLEEAPGRAVVQSAGNYRDKRLHAEGVVRPGGTIELSWGTPPDDPTVNELELWYSGRDRLRAELFGPHGIARVSAARGARAPVTVDGRTVGMLYHRAFDPLNGDHHVDVFLEPSAPAGVWTVRLVGEDVVDGRYHAWIERDSAVAQAQSRFLPGVATPRSTLGTVATGYRALVVGAFDPRSPAREPASFSSAGPTRDGRQKPDLLAPGVGIRAARSTAGGEPPGTGGETTMSGTSMAAPHVTGAVALVFEKAPRRLTAAETRLLVIGTSDPAEGDSMRTGHGILDTEAALAAVQSWLDKETNMSRSDPLDRYMTEALGPVTEFDIIGRAGGALTSALRPGDVLVRFDAALPVVAEVEDVELVDGESASDAGLPADEARSGYYARTRPLRRGVPSRPTYRRVLAGPSRVVAPRTVIARRRAPVVLRAPQPRASSLARAPEPLLSEPAEPFGLASPEPLPWAPAEPIGVAPPEPEPFAPGEPTEPVEPEEPEPVVECQAFTTAPDQVSWWDAELSDAELEASPVPQELRELLGYLRVSWPTFAPTEGAYFSALTAHLRRAGVVSGTATLDRITFRDAVRAFQTKRGMAPDGVPGEDVLFALQKDWAEARALGVVRADADKVKGSEGYDAFRLRSDIVDRYTAFRNAVRSAGGVVTSAGSLRDLDAAVGAGRSALSMHYSGMALDLATDTGMRDPERDPYVVVREGKRWRLFCRSPSAPARALDAVVWHEGAERTIPVRVKVFDLTEVAERHGFHGIGPRSSYPASYMSAEWWHLQCDAVLTPYVSQFGTELLSIDEVRYGNGRVTRYDEATLSRYEALWANRKRIFRRGRNGWA